MDITVKGERIRAMREKFGFSQQNVADELGLSKQTVCNMEAKSKALSEDEVYKLEKLFNCSRQYLTGEVETWNEVLHDEKPLTIPVFIDPYVAPVNKIMRSARQDQQEIMLYILREYEKHGKLKSELVKSAIPFIFDFIAKKETDITKLELLKRIADVV